jgi:hypothetical protein
MNTNQTLLSRSLTLVIFVFIFAAQLVSQAAATLYVKTGTHPSVLAPGQNTEIVVEVRSDSGVPLSQAYVTISAGGGLFIYNKKLMVEGMTDNNGVFVAYWQCTQCAPAYVFNVEVSKPGFATWRGNARVNIDFKLTPPPPTPQPPQPPGTGGVIRVHAAANPPNIPPGQPTEIVVRSETMQGHPLPQAEVRITAGGGVFFGSNTTVVYGQTDVHGVYRAPWKCMPCAQSYVFNIEVVKPGFNPGKGQAEVHIASTGSKNSNKFIEPLKKPAPDLVVSGVQIYPATPTAGKNFTVAVYVKNQGNAVSGQFDLQMHIKNLDRGYTYPIGTFRRNAMKPGEQIPWQKQDVMVNEPGAFQFIVEIVPFLFQDGNKMNNHIIRPFHVK